METEFIFHIVIILLLLVLLIFLYFHLPRSLVHKPSFWKQLFKKKKVSHKHELIHQLSWTAHWLASRKIGALIIIEGKTKLDNYATLGYPLKARVTSELLISIFSNKDSALHDGGVIIRGLEIISVSTYFPVAQLSSDLNFGARHRASMGITMQTDAIALIVSEATGAVSISAKGKIQEIVFEDQNILSEKLSNLLQNF